MRLAARLSCGWVTRETLGGDRRWGWGSPGWPFGGGEVKGAVDDVVGDIGQAEVVVAGVAAEPGESLWEAAGSTVAHIGNVTTTTPISGRQSELVPSGDLKVRVRVPSGGRYHVRAIVSGASAEVAEDDGWVAINMPPVVDHDVVVVEPMHPPE